jgi:hypothetical protein
LLPARYSSEGVLTFRRRRPPHGEKSALTGDIFVTLEDTDQLAQQRIARAFPNVPVRIISSVFSAYRHTMPTLPDAIRASHRRLADACALESSVGSHQDADGISVAIYLSQHDINLLNLGEPVDLRTADQHDGTLSVHVRRERRRFRRTPPDSAPHTQTAC